MLLFENMSELGFPSELKTPYLSMNNPVSLCEKDGRIFENDL